MASIQFSSALDKINSFKTYFPMVSDMSRTQLQMVVILLLQECDLDYAFDFAFAFGKKE